MNSYQQAFDKLNTQQKEAVTSIDGTVMVIAGPGTGKTQVIASRIAYILEKTDASPKNILCLTYTEAGTVAMKNRLIEFIGPTGHDVKISTFHGFCNEVIQENADFFGQKELEPIDELERTAILKKIIDGFEKDHPLKRYKGLIYYDAKNLEHLFSTMRKEDLTVDLLNAKVQEHLEDLKADENMYYKRNGKGFSKGDFKQKAFDEEKGKFDKLLAGAIEFENYLKSTREKGFYDFDDMILWVKKAFKTNDYILKKYQERYQYILVDEYQDTNGSQNEVVELLASYFENPNLFVVGDDDQSIYRFQGANMDNIIDFQNKYKSHLLTIPMTTNYRSSQLILNASMNLIGNNKSRLLHGDEKNLKAGIPEKAKSTTKPQILEFANAIDEYAYVANYLINAHKNNEDLTKIAVLYRSHADANPLIEFLQKKEVPVNTAKSINILQDPLVLNLLSLLDYFKCELDQPYSRQSDVFQLLTLPWFNLENITVSNFSYWARMEWSKWVYEEDEDRHLKYHWRYLLNHVQEGSKYLSQDEIKKLEEINASIEYLLTNFKNYTLPQFIIHVMDHCMTLKWIVDSDEKEWNLEVYRAFFTFVTSETRKNPRLNLGDLFDLVKTMREENIAIKLSKTLIDKKGVNFVSTHASKGLEFDTVFLINAVSKSWNRKARTSGFKYPPNLFHETADEELVNEEESRRLFYVAMTRAEQNLHITYGIEDMFEKSQVPSKFVDELLNAGEVEKKYPTVDKNLAFEFVKCILEPEIAGPTLIPNDWMHALLEDYYLSPTDLNSYINCATGFYYEKILRIPKPKHEALSLGSATHEAIELFIRQSREEKRVLEKDEFLQLYTQSLNRQRDALTKKAYDNFLEYGEILLGHYYDLKLVEYEFLKITPELNVRARIDDHTLLKGMMDRVEEDSNSLLVFDYKTGKYHSEKFKSPGDKYPKDENIEKYGGEYWRQAVFYSVLLNHSEFYLNYNVNLVIFEFLETAKDADSFKDVKVLISPEDKHFMKKLITDVFSKIKNLEFADGCKKEDCRWCNLGIN